MASYPNVLALTVVAIVTSELLGPVAGRGCPGDVENATSQCLSDHHLLLQNIQQSEKHFFAGIDAEIIRTSCHEFKTRSMHCVNQIRKNCPESADRRLAIETALRPYTAFITICYHRQHFIEEYAIIANCMYSRRVLTGVCYDNFLSATAGQEHIAWQNQHSAVLSYCRSLSELTTCVQSSTQSCDSETSRHKTNKLISLLVSVSVELSFKCSDDSLGISTTPSSTHRGGGSSGSGGAKRNFFSRSSSAPATLVSQTHLLLTLSTGIVLVRTVAALGLFAKL